MPEKILSNPSRNITLKEPMQQKCTITGELFEIPNAELEFIEKVSPVFAGKKYLLPPPNIHPQERLRQRLSFRNLRYLFKRNCDLTGKPMLSMYDPLIPRLVYHAEEFWSDHWDPLSYGVDFDFSKTFFEQVADLTDRVPRLHNFVFLNENCEYINGAANCRNCYLSFNMDYCEDCYYIHSGTHTRSTLDSQGVVRCELCYGCVDCENCYSLNYSDQCSTCSESFFLSNCLRCKNCIGCTNLVDKEYYLFNKPSTKEEIERLKASFSSLKAVNDFQIRVDELRAQYPLKQYFGNSNEDFSGNSVRHIKNSYECFESSELENCNYCYYVFKANNCYDYTIFGDNSQWIYQCLATGINCSNNLFCMVCGSGASNNMYCNSIRACTDCFACVGLKQKQFCIFNKQYTEPEYHQLAAKIAEHMQQTGEWGQFFPPALSPFPFNETIAFDEYPLSQEEALRRRYNWREPEEKKSILPIPLVPDRIEDTPDSICSQTLICSETGAAFKIIPQELAFYRRQGIPVPTLCPNARYTEFKKKRSARQLWTRDCDSCKSEMRTPYTPDRREKIYCEKCFVNEVY